jgi:hypothetical protein
MQQRNAKGYINRQDDREFHALPEYIVTFSKRYFYSDKKLKKLFGKIVAKCGSWESDCKVAFISFDLFFSISVQTKI